MDRLDENKEVILDGQPVTLKYVREQQEKRKDAKIVEIREGEFKTLTRMRG